MVLEKDSSILGYPGEVSKALDADHHGVCKFEGRHDPNYLSVRNFLKTVMSKIIAKDQAKNPVLTDRRALLDLKDLLALRELPGLDLDHFHDQWTENTHEWIKTDDEFQAWCTSEVGMHLLWVRGGGGTGKSILASTIVNHLGQQGRRCQFFFIRYGHRQKRTLSLLLRSFAYQIGQAFPSLVPKMTELGTEEVDFEAADPRIMWERLFKAIIFNADFGEPLHWVIDGVDEAESPRALIKTLLNLASTSPVKIVFTSRRYTEIEEALDKRPRSIRFSTINLEDRQVDDIRTHVRQELKIAGSNEVRARVEEQLLKHSQSNFLVSYPPTFPREQSSLIKSSCSGFALP